MINRKQPHISKVINDPKSLLNYIYNGGEIYYINKKYTLYDGRCCNYYDGTPLDPRIIDILTYHNFICESGGNFDTGEVYFHLNEEYDIKDKKMNLHILNDVIDIIKKLNLKDKYKNIIRSDKLKRIVV